MWLPRDILPNCVIILFIGTVFLHRKHKMSRNVVKFQIIKNTYDNLTTPIVFNI